jgi:hypothetical protein
MNREIDQILCNTVVDTRVAVHAWHPNPWDSTGVLLEDYMICCAARGCCVRARG